jgi:hypothetical protein
VRNKLTAYEAEKTAGEQPFLTSISNVNHDLVLTFFGRHSALGRSTMATNRSGGSKRGFAAMDPAKQREIASKGGKASHGGGRKSRSSR